MHTEIVKTIVNGVVFNRQNNELREEIEEIHLRCYIPSDKY